MVTVKKVVDKNELSMRGSGKSKKTYTDVVRNDE